MIELRNILGNQSNYKNIILILAIVFLTFMAKKMFDIVVSRILSKKDNLIKVIEPLHRPINIMIFIAGIFFVIKSVSFNIKYYIIAIKALKILFSIDIIYLSFQFVDILNSFLQIFVNKSETTLDNQLLPVLRKTLKTFVVIVGSLIILDNVGINVTSLIAGLGIGGLAFAFAAKDTLSNIFGAIMIFTDRPFSVGERIVINGTDGTVEEIGLRSTRIRTLSDHLVTIPNGIVANETILNIGKRRSIKRILTISITYDTVPAKVKESTEIIKNILKLRSETGLIEKDYFVYFKEFAASSLDIMVLYWVAPPDYFKYLDISEGINMDILTQFNQAGIEFAFPTQSLYINK